MAALGLPATATPKPATPAAPTTTTPTAQALPTTVNGVTYSPTSATNSLLGQTLSVGPTANRYQVAGQQFNEFANQTAPQYAQALKQATSAGATAGQLGSGQLRTSYGDLANQRDQQLQNASSSFLTDALNNSIQDQYNNVGIAQQQQAFQGGLQSNAFNQGLSTLLAGESGNPSATDLALAQLYGSTANQGENALSGLIGNSVQNTTATNANSAIQQILNQYGLPSTSATPTYNGTYNVGNGVMY